MFVPSSSMLEASSWMAANCSKNGANNCSALINAILDQVSFIMIIEPFLAESMIMEQNKSKVFQTLILTMKSVIIT